MEKPNALFPIGDKTSPDYFTGNAWLNMLLLPDENINFAIGDVFFEPGCRNNWHTHGRGQILIITDGKGYYQEKEKPAQLITKGDVVKIGPNIEHWHGAAKDNSLTHIAITLNSEKGAVTWLAPVSDEEYESVH